MRKQKRNIFLQIISLRWLLAAPILFYKKCISPLLPSTCGYYPTCSVYMLDCINRHGIKGVAYGLVRLAKCNPLTKGGFDPVPCKKGDYKWLY